MLKCKQVTRLVATDEFQELRFMKKMEFRLHLMMCSHCQRYFDQIKSMGKGARESAKALEAGEEQLERMETGIREDLGDSKG